MSLDWDFCDGPKWYSTQKTPLVRNADIWFVVKKRRKDRSPTTPKWHFVFDFKACKAKKYEFFKISPLSFLPITHARYWPTETTMWTRTWAIGPHHEINHISSSFRHVIVYGFREKVKENLYSTRSARKILQFFFDPLTRRWWCRPWLSVNRWRFVYCILRCRNRQFFIKSCFFLLGLEESHLFLTYLGRDQSPLQMHLTKHKK